MARKTPTVENDILVLWDYDLDRKITEHEVGSQYWFEWLDLETEKSFRYISNVGTFTAIKERREVGRSRSGDKVYYSYLWYAHRQINKKLRRKYLGVSKNLTKEKLRQVALDLAQLALDPDG